MFSRRHIIPLFVYLIHLPRLPWYNFSYPPKHFTLLVVSLNAPTFLLSNRCSFLFFCLMSNVGLALFQHPSSLSMFSSNAPSYVRYFQNHISTLAIPLGSRLKIQCLVELLYGWQSKVYLNSNSSIYFLGFLILCLPLSSQSAILSCTLLQTEIGKPYF